MLNFIERCCDVALEGSTRSTVAAVVIAKNEERNISDCLQSLLWAEEVLVVDADSSDKTAELAKAAGARVIVRAWPGYGAQKNFAMEQVAAEWVLIVDADERVSQELHAEIASIVR